MLLHYLHAMVNVSETKRKEYLATGTGLAVGMLPMAVQLKDELTPVKPKDIPSLKSFMNIISPSVDTFENTMTVAEKILQEEGLAKKGVGIFVANNTPESVAGLDDLFKDMKPKKLVESTKNILRNGCNACYCNNIKKAIISNEGGHSLIFHELGHAKHFNSKNIFMKALVHSREITQCGVSLFAPIALGIAMFHNTDKTKPKKDKSIKDKTLDFISNHAGKLTLATYAPLLLEEGLASVDGIKMAKKHLKPEQISKLKGQYAKAWGTYALVAIGISGAVGLASIVKNSILNKKQPTETKQA